MAQASRFRSKSVLLRPGVNFAHPFWESFDGRAKPGQAHRAQNFHARCRPVLRLARRWVQMPCAGPLSQSPG